MDAGLCDRLCRGFSNSWDDSCRPLRVAARGGSGICRVLLACRSAGICLRLAGRCIGEGVATSREASGHTREFGDLYRRVQMMPYHALPDRAAPRPARPRRAPPSPAPSSRGLTTGTKATPCHVMPCQSIPYHTSPDQARPMLATPLPYHKELTHEPQTW